MASPPYWVWYPGIILVFSLLPLYYPNGRLVSPRWRVATWLAVVIGFLETIVAAVRPGDAETPGVPNPLGIESLQGGVVTGVVSLMWLPLGGKPRGALQALAGRKGATDPVGRLRRGALGLVRPRGQVHAARTLLVGYGSRRFPMQPAHAGLWLRPCTRWEREE